MLYVGTLNSLASGYAQAGLHHLCSLAHAGFTDFGIFTRMAIPWNTFPAWCEPLRTLPNGATRTPILVHNTSDQLATTLRRDGVYFGMTAIDTDRCPRWAAIAINRTFAKLIVPSTHSEAAARNGGIKIPIAVVPHTMHAGLWLDQPASIPHTECVFYFIGSWNARKNPEDLVRAYIRAFPAEDTGTRLVLKLTAPDGVREAAFDLIRDEMRKLGKGVGDEYTRRDVVINCGHVSEREIRELHAYGDVYVSPHRGEAFGIAAFEAALLGRPVVYTDWSGPRDFLSPARGDFPVAWQSVAVAGMSGMAHYSGTQEWAQPDLDALVEALRQAAAARRQASCDDLRQAHSYSVLGPRLLEALELK